MVTHEAEQLATLLGHPPSRIVLAESCTAGMAAALLAAVPGISEHLCGSFVTYREECKQAWLGVSADLLRTHTAVSAEVTAAMAVAALDRTSSAQYSAAITGHLGPNAPAKLDGVCFVAIGRRQAERIDLVEQRQLTLSTVLRTDRQAEAAKELIVTVSTYLARQQPSDRS